MSIDITRRQMLAGAAAISAATFLNMRPAVAGSTGPALFVTAHPDDETLCMGVAIAEHVAAGQDVHILWLTRGTTSGARSVINGTGTNSWWGVKHNPAAEGYDPLTASAFGQARIGESTAAVRCLAAGLTGSVTFHEAGLMDGEVTQTDAETAIREVADAINPSGPVRVKTHTHIVDDHPDHVAAGYAARHLQATDARFANLRHYILPRYWSDARLSKVSECWDTPASTDIRHRAVNAYRAFSAWHPPASYAIGYHSVPELFGKLTAGPRCLFHT